jgi:hypothetical protein
MARLFPILLFLSCFTAKSNAMSQTLYLISGDSTGRCAIPRMRLSDELLTFIFAYNNCEDLSCISILSDYINTPIDTFFIKHISPNDGLEIYWFRLSEFNCVMESVATFYGNNRIDDYAEEALRRINNMDGFISCSSDLSYIKNEALNREIMAMHQYMEASFHSGATRFALLLV